MCMCMYMCMCLCMCGDIPHTHMCPCRTEEDAGSPGIRVTGCCGLPDVVLIKDPLEEQQCSWPRSDLPSPKEKTFKKN